MIRRNYKKPNVLGNTWKTFRNDARGTQIGYGTGVAIATVNKQMPTFQSLKDQAVLAFVSAIMLIMINHKKTITTNIIK